MIRKKGHRVPSTSTIKVRALSSMFRNIFSELGASATGKVDIIEILDCYLPHVDSNFIFEIVPDVDLGEDHAQTLPDRNLIRVKESVYDGARVGNGRDIFTLAHELGHLFLHRNVSSFARSNEDSNHKIYEDSEWQADCFAAEFLMPYAEAINCKSENEIVERFGVSYKAAEVRFEKICSKR